eukprot:TRINITY_DN17360_c0_g2_i1.p1 TRINITY_DN17360_c0_g2~~TRINITY_DN17360_c0_g2_i1.p1  ORF type:complete len:125 (-),score=28.99 TRINITY_DN17360_c0_g2_i1:43-417(-)
MSPWCCTTFAANGLLSDIKESTLGLEEAERQVLEFVKKCVAANSAPLAGNSCYVDRAFIRREMPLLDGYLREDNLDVSSIAQCCYRWRPELISKLKKSQKHRGLDDIKESIEELKVYKEHLFSC